MSEEEQYTTVHSEAKENKSNRYNHNIDLQQALLASESSHAGFWGSQGEPSRAAAAIPTSSDLADQAVQAVQASSDPFKAVLRKLSFKREEVSRLADLGIELLRIRSPKVLATMGVLCLGSIASSGYAFAQAKELGYEIDTLTNQFENSRQSKMGNLTCAEGSNNTFSPNNYPCGYLYSSPEDYASGFPEACGWLLSHACDIGLEPVLNIVVGPLCLVFGLALSCVIFQHGVYKLSEQSVSILAQMAQFDKLFLRHPKESEDVFRLRLIVLLEGNTERLAMMLGHFSPGPRNFANLLDVTKISINIGESRDQFQNRQRQSPEFCQGLLALAVTLPTDLLWLTMRYYGDNGQSKEREESTISIVTNDEDADHGAAATSAR